VFAYVDLDGVKKAIASKQNLTQTQMAEFAKKQLSVNALSELSASSKPVIPVETKVENPEAKQDEKEKLTEQFMAEAKIAARKALNLDPK
jgi:hypothetical protein